MNILFSTRYAPWPTRGGSSQRSLHLFRALESLGRVRMVTLENHSIFTEDELEHLRERYGLVGTGPVTAAGTGALWAPVRRLSRPLAAALAHNLDGSRSRFRPDPDWSRRIGMPRLLEGVDLVVGRYATSLTRLDLQHATMPSLLDVDDVDSDIYRSRTAALSRWSPARAIVARHARHIARGESTVYRAVDHCWVSNPENLDHPALGDATVLPNIPWLPDGEQFNTDPVASDATTVLCVATFRHGPNIEGVEWFVRHVWPRVRTSRPDARFRIVGAAMDPALKARWSAEAGVTADGFVPEITPVYRDAALCVCPVNRGAGTNIKVLEACAHRRSCVLTATAARGFSTDPDLLPHLPVAADADAMADRIVALLASPTENDRTASALAEVVRKTYSPDGFRRIVEQTLESVLARRQRG